jgi:hypothetical protein
MRTPTRWPKSKTSPVRIRKLHQLTNPPPNLLRILHGQKRKTYASRIRGLHEMTSPAEPPTQAMQTEDQGDVYASFIEGQLAAEHERRKSMDTRGSTLITASSALVAVLGTVSAFALRGKEFSVPCLVKASLFIALPALALAGICGIFSNWIFKYPYPEKSTMQEMLGTHWADDPVDSRGVGAYLNLKLIVALRRTSACRAWLLMIGQTAQVIALIALVCGSMTLLHGAPTAEPLPSGSATPTAPTERPSSASPTPRKPPFPTTSQ